MRHFAHEFLARANLSYACKCDSVCVCVSVCVCDPNVRCDTENSSSHLDLKRVSEYYELSMARRKTESAAYQKFT